jgi:hypothetical protein
VYWRSSTPGKMATSPSPVAALGHHSRDWPSAAARRESSLVPEVLP